MARRLIWTVRARNDLFELLDWIARDAPIYASGVSVHFERKVETLPSQSGVGRPVPEYEGTRDLREVFVHRWRMIYEVTDTSVQIVAIVHGARLLENAITLE